MNGLTCLVIDCNGLDFEGKATYWRENRVDGRMRLVTMKRDTTIRRNNTTSEMPKATGTSGMKQNRPSSTTATRRKMPRTPPAPSTSRTRWMVPAISTGHGDGGGSDEVIDEYLAGPVATTDVYQYATSQKWCVEGRHVPPLVFL